MPQDWHDPEVPGVLTPSSPSWGSTGTSTKQPTNPTGPGKTYPLSPNDPTGRGNTDTVNPKDNPETNNDDSTEKPDADTTGPSGQQNSAPTKKPDVIIPFDWDTPADEQIDRNTWYILQHDKNPDLPNFHPIPYSNKIPASEQMEWNDIDEQLRGKDPMPVHWSNTIPASEQIRQQIDEAESKVRNEACKAARANGSPIDVRV